MNDSASHSEAREHSEANEPSTACEHSEHSTAQGPGGLTLAAGLFSIVPMPGVMIDRRDARRAVSWFPVLGALIGLAGGGVGAAILFVADAPLLAAALCLVVTQALIGAMHLDGLADTFDGLAALGSKKQGRTAQTALEVMHKPDIGSLGVAAIVLVLLTQLAALATIAGSQVAQTTPTAAALTSAQCFLCAAVLGGLGARLSTVYATKNGVPPARPGGFGALFAQVTPTSTVVGWWITALVIAAGLGWWTLGLAGAIGFAITMVLSIAGTLVWSARWIAQFGGLTGDMMGALVELAATTCWVGLAITTALR